MRILVIEPIHQQLPKPNTYTVRYTTMSGDADAFDTTSIDGFRVAKDKPALESLVTLLKNMKAFFEREGRGGGIEEAYSRVIPEFTDWFEDPHSSDPTEYSPVAAEFMQRTQQTKKHVWPQDVYAGYGAGFHDEQTITEYEVIYYDENSKPYKTAVLFD